MESGDKSKVDIDSMDLYSRVKLRGLSSKARLFPKDIFTADEEFDGPGLRKSKINFGKRSFSMTFSTYKENQDQQNANAGGNARLRSLIEVSVGESDEWKKKHKKDLSDRRNNAHDFDNSDHMLDEGTAVEMLGQLREGKNKNICNLFDIGDLVWGKIKSYPWWPGQIYNEAFASSAVLSSKREGYVLVAFYGDYTYAWLDPRYLTPFDIHYAEKSRQTDDIVFLEAVEQAGAEFKRRAALGLVCHCQKPSNFRPMNVGELFEVNFNGFIAGGIYSARQIAKARDNFQPDETFSFLKQLALCPRSNATQNLSWVNHMVKVAFYRRTSLQNFDESCPRANEQQQSSQDPESSPVDKAALVGLLEAKARESKQVTEANDLYKKDDALGQKQKSNFSGSRFSHEGSGDHEMKVPSERSDSIVSEGLHYEPLQKLIESDGAIHARKKRSEMTKPVKEKNMKELSRVSGHQNLFLHHSEERMGIETNSSIKLEKESVTETDSIRSKVEPRMLVIQFPHGVILPSVSELKAKFAPFGPLHESSSSVAWESSRCQVVFHQKTDAAAAYWNAIQNRTLFSSPVSYKLQMVEVVGSELPKSRQSLTKPVEDGHVEIQSEASLSRTEYCSEAKPTVRPLLHSQRIKREPCLEGPSCASAFTAPHLATYNYGFGIPQNMVPPVASPSASLRHTTEKFGFNHTVDDIGKTYSQVETAKNNDHCAIPNTNDAGTKDKLIDLLHSCSNILGKIKPVV